MAYLRVSTDDQQLGVEAQRSAIEQWAARQGVDVASWHVDAGVSGAAPVDERPGLLAALSALEGEATILVAAKRDRLARDVVVAATIERLASRSGATVVTADGVSSASTPEGVLMRTLLDAFAQYERALIRARTKAALGTKRARGQRVSRHIPYGLRVGDDGSSLVPHDDERTLIDRIRTLSGSGLSTRRIAALLDEEGVACRGTRWHHTSIAKIVRNFGDSARSIAP